MARLVVTDHKKWLRGAEISVGGIQGVFTEPQYRNRGLSRYLIEDTMGYLFDRGYDVTILHSVAVRDMYSKFGFSNQCFYPTISKEISLEKKIKEPRLIYAKKSSFTDLEISKWAKFSNDFNVSKDLTSIRTVETLRLNAMNNIYGKAEHFFLEKDSKLSAYFSILSDLDSSFLGDFENTLIIAEVMARENEFENLLDNILSEAHCRKKSRVVCFLPRSHEFSLFCLKNFFCEGGVHYTDQGLMMRLINPLSLLQKMESYFTCRYILSSLNSFPAFCFQAEIGEQFFSFRNNKVIVRSFGDCEFVIKFDHISLSQLISGYIGVDDVVKNTGVNIPPEIASLIGVLFPKSEPFSWLLDHF